jgi:hypothetical protein
MKAKTTTCNTRLELELNIKEKKMCCVSTSELSHFQKTKKVKKVKVNSKISQYFLIPAEKK